MCVHCTSVKTVFCKWISHSKSNVFELLSGCHDQIGTMDYNYAYTVCVNVWVGVR